MKRPRVVGVRDLRAHLSAYLRDVARGETVTLGDRRKTPIARLVPIRRSPDVEKLEGRAASGSLTLGSGKPQGGSVRRRSKKPLLSDLVVEDRR